MPAKYWLFYSVVKLDTKHAFLALEDLNTSLVCGPCRWIIQAESMVGCRRRGWVDYGVSLILRWSWGRRVGMEFFKAMDAKQSKASGDDVARISEMKWRTKKMNRKGRQDTCIGTLSPTQPTGSATIRAQSHGKRAWILWRVVLFAPEFCSGVKESRSIIENFHGISHNSPTSQRTLPHLKRCQPPRLTSSHSNTAFAAQQSRTSLMALPLIISYLGI